MTKQAIKEKLANILRLVNTFLAMQEKKETQQKPGLEKEYLQGLSKKLTESVKQFGHDEEDQPQEIVQILNEIMHAEEACRAKYEIGARFHVIQSQLQALTTAYKKESDIKEMVEDIQQSTGEMKSDEEIVYVYLFNAQGAKFHTWLSVLTPKALMDHSINRPVYAKFEHIDELLRSKTDIEQHAYIKAHIKKSDIIMSLDNSILKDALGNKLLRLKYGSLTADKIVYFFHRNKEYTVSKDGELKLQEV